MSTRATVERVMFQRSHAASSARSVSALIRALTVGLDGVRRLAGLTFAISCSSGEDTLDLRGLLFDAL